MRAYTPGGSPFCKCGKPRRPSARTCHDCHATKMRQWRGRHITVALTDRQVELRREHGTPAEFASAVYGSVPGDISMDEARAAIEDYNREWAEAGATTG